MREGAAVVSRQPPKQQERYLAEPQLSPFPIHTPTTWLIPVSSPNPHPPHLSVVLGDLDGEALELCHIGRQPAEALTAAAANAHQQAVAAGLLQDAVDAADVVQRIPA